MFPPDSIARHTRNVALDRAAVRLAGEVEGAGQKSDFVRIGCGEHTSIEGRALWEIAAENGQAPDQGAPSAGFEGSDGRAVALDRAA